MATAVAVLRNGRKIIFFFLKKGALSLGLQPLPPAWSCRHCGWEEQGIAKMEK